MGLRLFSLFCLLLAVLSGLGADAPDYVVQIALASTNKTRLTNTAAYINGTITNLMMTRNVSQFTNIWNTNELKAKWGVSWHITFTNTLAGSNQMWFTYWKCATQDLSGAPELVGGVFASMHRCPREGTNPPAWGDCKNKALTGYTSTNR